MMTEGWDNLHCQWKMENDYSPVHWVCYGVKLQTNHGSHLIHGNIDLHFSGRDCSLSILERGLSDEF